MRTRAVPLTQWVTKIGQSLATGSPNGDLAFWRFVPSLRFLSIFVRSAYLAGLLQLRRLPKSLDVCGLVSMGTTDGPQTFRDKDPGRVLGGAANPARSEDGKLEAANLLIPKAPARVFEKTVVEPRQPRFLPQAREYHFHWKDLLEEFFSLYPLHLRNISVDLFRDVPLLPRRFAARPLAASLILHMVAIPLLPVLLAVIPRKHASDDTWQNNSNSVVYYHVQKLGPLPKLPRLSPFGPGSSPGIGTPMQQAAEKGATQALSALFAVSRPHIPDNNHQTILEPRTSPDLKIKNDLKLPNLVSAETPPPKPRVRYVPNDARPQQPRRAEVRAEAPKLSATDSTPQPNGLAILPTEHARLAVPLGNVSAPIVATRGQGVDPGVAPTFADVAGNNQNSQPISVAEGRVAAPVGNASVPNLSRTGGKGLQLDAAPVFDTNIANDQGLVVLNVDPGGPAEILSLPEGNRYGSFGIAPGVSRPGSPGGREAAAMHGGVGGAGPGGNESSGIGRGSSGGGGGNDAAASGFISMRGRTDSNNLLADPGPAAVAQMVYALPAASLLRHNTLVVSAGPIGGGGSNVYGKLPCGKIYTVFLPTGGKQWPLQFCEKTNEQRALENKGRTTVVHTELPLIPPEAKESYDFKRLPLPPEKAGKSIILRGAISEDGNVEEVDIHQGLLPAMDAAARLAFSQWKFKPALRSGKPVRVEILVAIPGA